MAREGAGFSVKKVIQILHAAGILTWLVLSSTVAAFIAIFCRIFSAKLPRTISRIWSYLFTLVFGVRLRIRGRENLDPKASYLFVSNHLSSTDILILHSALYHSLIFMAKKELFQIPVFGWGMRAAGDIPVDRKNPRKAREAVRKAEDLLKRGKTSLIAFPEGTRSLTGQLGPFKLGIFSVAITAGVPVVPIALQGTFELLPKGIHLVSPRQVYVSIGKPIPIAETGKDKKSRIAEDARKQIVQFLESEHSIE